MSTPSWLNPAINPTTIQPVVPARHSSALPEWLSVKPTRQHSTKAKRELMAAQFEMVWPRVIECVCGGSTLANALRDLPVEIDHGAFTAWLYKNPRYKAIYLEAKEIRTEFWTGEMVRYATGDETNPVELDRAKVIIDTYKWLVSRQNRKEYGDVKTLEMNTTISITAALQSASQRVIEAAVVTDDEMDLMGEDEFQQLAAASTTDDENDDE